MARQSIAAATLLDDVAIQKGTLWAEVEPIATRDFPERFVARCHGFHDLRGEVALVTIAAHNLFAAGSQSFVDHPRSELIAEPSVAEDTIESLREEIAVLRRRLAVFSEIETLDLGPLSPRELQIFVAIGSGQTTPEIAATMQLAGSTVETYRERIKHKLNLKSGYQLTRLAILYSLRDPGIKAVAP